MTLVATLDDGAVADLGAWVTEAGLLGLSAGELLSGFCERARAAGLPIATALVLVDTLHPVHEGRAFRWRRENANESAVVEYGRSDVDEEAAQRWRRSPMYHLVQTGASTLRRRLTGSDPLDFPALEELRAAGVTDYLAIMHRFSPSAVIGEMDCVHASWAADDPDGFSDRHLAALLRLSPSLALAVKAASLAQIAETLVETYLGRDAGRRVLSGYIQRGTAERIEAALWFSDLRGYTRITGAAPPEQIIPFLNDYADAVISSVHEAGGDVLKLIGDGTLAIFHSGTLDEACRCALAAERIARGRVAELNAKRRAKGLPVTETYLGLHVGEVFYGNIGSRERLDFTVVGPAVNEAARIAAMCRSVERAVLASSSFAQAAFPRDRERLVSVGRYALRGVERPQELFTIDPDYEA